MRGGKEADGRSHLSFPSSLPFFFRPSVDVRVDLEAQALWASSWREFGEVGGLGEAEWLEDFVDLVCLSYLGTRSDAPRVVHIYIYIYQDMKIGKKEGKGRCKKKGGREEEEWIGIGFEPTFLGDGVR
jgi:hypothetical protein